MEEDILTAMASDSVPQDPAALSYESSQRTKTDTSRNTTREKERKKSTWNAMDEVEPWLFHPNFPEEPSHPNM
jgi:hypothetical protein